MSDLAKKLGTSRAYMSSRLQRILDQRIARIVAHTSPLALGYHVFAMIGIKVLPSDTNAIADKLRYLPNVNGVVIVAGRHDIIIWTMFPTPIDLSALPGEGTGRDTGHHLGGMHHPAGAEEDVLPVPGAVAPRGAGRAEGGQGSAGEAGTVGVGIHHEVCPPLLKVDFQETTITTQWLEACDFVLDSNLPA